MRDYTFIRVEANVGPAARVLRKVPGVAVGDESAAPAEGDGFGAPRAGPGETPPPSDAVVDVSAGADDDSEGGLMDRLPPAVREYGLLLVGVLFLLVGIASAALWWLRRRGADEDSEAEPPTVDSFDEPVDEWRPDSDEDTGMGDTGDVATSQESESTDEPESGDPTDTAEPTLLDEEAATMEASAGELDSGPAVDSPAVVTEEAESDAERESADSTSRTAGSVDVAPLLGMGFLAVAAAVVKWSQRDTAGER
ncbi:hypothetical protein ACFQGE_01740 [Halomicroarcula sp. GCM10025817]|uniref:hypothetical protein n=1 Tax=Haloarcula TaxID=2237 RepID=UPI0023E8F3FC|nr:hypothetical protein [Halomicroarcula sp. SYNS111]